jgi:hypothetical protein
MKLSKREADLLRRGLDKATTPDEAETAAKNFFKELRRRGIDGYQLAPTKPDVAPVPAAESTAEPPEWSAPYRSAPSVPTPTAKAGGGGNGLGCLIFLVVVVFFHNFWVALLLMWLIPRLIYSKSFRAVGGVIFLVIAGIGLLALLISAIPHYPNVTSPIVYPTATPRPTPYPTPRPTSTPFPDTATTIISTPVDVAALDATPTPIPTPKNEIHATPGRRRSPLRRE